MSLNVTYDLDEDDVTVLHQPVVTSTPDGGQPLNSNALQSSADEDGVSAAKRVRFDVSPSPQPEPSKSPPLGLIVWKKEALEKAGLTPQRVRVKGKVSTISLSPAVNSPVPTKKTWTQEELDRAGLTPQRVPVKGKYSAAPSSAFNSPAPTKKTWTQEELEKAGLTPQRVPVKCKVSSISIPSTAFNSPFSTKKSSLIPSANVDTTAAGLPVWTQEALDKAGMTPMRVAADARTKETDRRPLGHMNGRISMLPGHSAVRESGFERRETGVRGSLRKEEAWRRQTWNCGRGMSGANVSGMDDEEVMPTRRMINFNEEEID